MTFVDYKRMIFFRVEPLIAALEQQQDFLPPAPTSLSPPPTSPAISSSRCPVLVKKEPFLVLQETSIIHHDHSYAFDSTSAAVKSMPFDDQVTSTLHFLFSAHCK